MISTEICLSNESRRYSFLTTEGSVVRFYNNKCMDAVKHTSKVLLCLFVAFLTITDENTW